MHMFDAKKPFLRRTWHRGRTDPAGRRYRFREKIPGNEKRHRLLYGRRRHAQGALHEAFNMAMTWLLPVVYIIENNNYAMGTSVERTSNVQELYKLGLSYDMPSEPVDGMSVWKRFTKPWNAP